MRYLIIILILFLTFCTKEPKDVRLLLAQGDFNTDTLYHRFKNNQQFFYEGEFKPLTSSGSFTVFKGLKNRKTYEDVFKVVYSRAQKMHLTLQGDRVNNFYFLFNYYLNHDRDSLELNYKRSQLAQKDNPSYTAYSLLIGSGVDTRSIGDDKYITQLATSFGVEKFYIRNAILHLMHYGTAVVMSNLIEMIEKNVMLFNGNKEQLFTDVIVPYMQIVVTAKMLDKEVENKIHKAFNSTYSAKGELARFIRAYRKTVHGGTINVRHINNLNRVFKEHGLYLVAEYNDCAGYAIESLTGSLDVIDGGSILFLKRAGISLSSAYQGRVTFQDKDIVLLSENINEKSKTLYEFVSGDKKYEHYNKNAEAVWRSIGLELDVRKADSIRKSLIKKEYENCCREKLTKILKRAVVVHEIKHIWDEIQDSRNSKMWNIDAEFSAYMAEALLSDAVFDSYLAMLAVQETFYLQTPVGTPASNHMKDIIKASWQEIRELENNGACAVACRKKVEKIYNEFKTMDGYSLPSINKFRNELPQNIVFKSMTEASVSDTIEIKGF